jgi:hypothetical protein
MCCSYSDLWSGKLIAAVVVICSYEFCLRRPKGTFGQRYCRSGGPVASQTHAVPTVEAAPTAPVAADGQSSAVTSFVCNKPTAKSNVHAVMKLYQ